MVISPKAKLSVSKQKNQNQGNSNSVITTLAFTHETEYFREWLFL